MNSNGLDKPGLENLFNLYWTTPREDLLKNFLQTWERTKDGRIIGRVHGQEILIER